MRHQSLVLKNSTYGLGVFTTESLEPGTFLIEMTGPLLSLAEIPSVEDRSILDHYIQCSENKFLGPSGDFDDIFNHSCEPNAGLFFENNQILIKTIKKINTGEEIFYDYSTVITNDPFVMKCACATPLCRGEVREFKSLPEKIRKKYIQLNIVPPYVVTAATTKAPTKKQRQQLFPLTQSTHTAHA